MERIRILVVDDNADDVRAVHAQLAKAAAATFMVSEASRLSEALVKLGSCRFDVVLLDLELPDALGRANIEALRVRAPSVPIVAVTDGDDEESALDALDAGAEEHLPRAACNDARLVRVLRCAIERRRAKPQLVLASLPPDSLACLKPARSGLALYRGRLVGFVGTRGGTGTSTVAFNVATSLAAEGRSVILVELTSHNGGMASLSRQLPRDNLRSLLDMDVDAINAESVRSRLHRDPRGFRILFAAQTGREFYELSPPRASSILRSCASLAECVIVDIPALPTRALQSVIRLFRRLVLVTSADAAALAARRASAELFVAWGIDADRLCTVVTPARSGETRGAELHLPIAPVIAELPPGGEELRAAERAGVPLVAVAQHHPLALEIMLLATAVLPEITADAPAMVA